MTLSNEKIYVVILAFNEAESLPDVVEDVNKILQGKFLYECFVVDDGSTDGTEKLLKQLSSRFPLNFIRHPINQGVGAAFRSGLTYVIKKAHPEDLLVIMEGDKTSDTNCLLKIIEKLKEGTDVVCSSRFIKGGAYRGFPLKRYIFSILANYLICFFFPLIGVKDYTIFYRGYRVGTVQEALHKYKEHFIQCHSFAANVEILLKIAKTKPIKCCEVPMIYRYDLKRGKSKMKIIKNIMEYLQIFWRNLI